MYLLAYDSKLVIIVPLLVIGLHFASANQLRERAERSAWQQLAQATDEFNEVDLDGVLHGAVLRAAELFSADEVELQVETPLVPARLVRGYSTAIGYDGSPAAAPESPSNHTIPVALESHDGAADVGELRLRFRRNVSLSERERYTLRTFAAALCTAVRNAAAFSETRRLSDDHARAAAHDPLTGLANRRQLLEVGAGHCADRTGAGITGLLLIDLNHFKEINDTLGHAAGDRVLGEVALRLAAAAHPDDLVARLGGDEFAVLFAR
ncbi:MAG: GGDEF domain-containing protein, partial [Micromonosporaceae bacterium]|nr:GGDEF domain-containing protein [Micromonosporaceae bacterium]